MPIALVLVSQLAGALAAALAALSWQSGLVGTMMAWWVGGLAGAALLILWVVLRSDPGDDADTAPLPIRP